VKLHKNKSGEESKDLHSSTCSENEELQSISRKGSQSSDEMDVTEQIVFTEGSGTPTAEKQGSKYDKANNLKKKKHKAEKDVVLCVVDDDTQLKSDKPFFIYSRKKK